MFVDESVERLDPAFDALVARDANIETLAMGIAWAEGPVWVAASRTCRFSDIPGNRILQFSEVTGELTTYQQGVEFTNGCTLDLDGSVVQCSHGRRRVERDRDGVSAAAGHPGGRRAHAGRDLQR